MYQTASHARQCLSPKSNAEESESPRIEPTWSWPGVRRTGRVVLGRSSLKSWDEDGTGTSRPQFLGTRTGRVVLENSGTRTGRAI